MNRKLITTNNVFHSDYFGILSLRAVITNSVKGYEIETTKSLILFAVVIDKEPFET